MKNQPADSADYRRFKFIENPLASKSIHYIELT